MSHPATHPPHAVQDIAAVLGAMLCALLAALFGPAGTRARGRAERFPDVMTGVLRAIDGSAMGESAMDGAPEVEWVMVPAPWRHARLLPRAHARCPIAVLMPSPRPGALVHGPPAPLPALRGASPGMATWRCAGASARPVLPSTVRPRHSRGHEHRKRHLRMACRAARDDDLTAPRNGRYR